ncbi:MAG: DUF1440 domain-containing protein [Chloroflexi bacterium]|nr:DUF1440 domain-containing protein [Chloroflexota bacterium]
MNAPMRFAKGAAAGLIATAPMTAVMLGWHRKLPWWQRDPLPPSKLTTRILRAVGLKKLDDEAHEPLTWISHFGYGAASGALFPLAESLMRDLPPPIHPKGVVYGLLIWTGSYLGWIPAVGLLEPATEHPKQRNMLMIAAHLVWGATMAALYGMWRDNERKGG